MPSAQSEKEPLAALFLCAAARLAVWKYGGGRLPRDLHPNPQPSAKRDMAAPRWVGLCLRRRAKKSRLRLFFFARPPAAYAAEHLIRRDKLGTFPRWGRQRITSAFMQCAKFRLFQWFCGNCIFDNLTRPSPAGEGGPRQRWMRCLCTRQCSHSTNWRNAVGSA